MFKSVAHESIIYVATFLVNEMNVVKFQIKIATISMIIIFLLSNEGAQVILKLLGTDKMAFLLMQHEMLVHFIGFFQWEQLDTSEYILTYSLETRDCTSNHPEMQKIQHLKIKLLIPSRSQTIRLL